MFNSQDATYMARALALAARGRFTVSPNPAVGCVLVKDNQIVGEGYHQQAGGPHAEVFALRQAAEATKGATAYVTLEPCSHYGRTPPCAQALIDAGVVRVVVASEDANPQVSGSGLRMLHAAGIDANAGLMTAESVAINRGFMHRMQTGRPFVTLKLAATLDGRTALANGQSQWITGPAARRDVQHHRALSCAILSGADTVLVDNASLNVRWQELPTQAQADYANAISDQSKCPRVRQPLRVIIDTRNRLTPSLKLFSVPGPILLVRGQVTGGFTDQVEECVLPLRANHQLDLTALLTELGRRQINALWVEAGARLGGALLEEELIDELVLYQAPKLMGSSARGLFDVPERIAMSEVTQLQWQDCRHIGNDIKLTATFVKNES
ncbi:bifunctional diaminohydroxyphosphoribosylaminopyrimidine deaminase/5-amino-6-(5-phosphoribosylamino)uracil reductase RibD [Oceanisphaera pacifica]|uniref:Riboflavin biosynthesis protein RibD n=1 Tax=Oceanisphaera pacifica TaxID=2818389 RepID=A0ABS3NCU9_9GAMM|nr:bifunctional diaminohydroxyphosphoribosylaminopyrimidine deaminase/5-amino-6-(5-phosphoribosylamino)uracil reductase RibD [Oceanisphaera pacifica]